jgi:hypothetical protein
MQLKEKRNKYYALFEEVLGEYWKDEAKALLDKILIECASSKGPADCNTENKTSQSLVLIFVGMVIHYCSSLYI